MMKKNGTFVKEFLLLGFSNYSGLRIPLFMVFLSIYILTITGNILIITVILKDLQLHKPMYFFLTNLSVLEICYTSNIVPNMLSSIFSRSRVISFEGCIVQLFFFGSLGSTECFLLGVMALDRYLAICAPLRYSAIMNNRMCIRLAASSWLSGFIATFAAVILISGLHFCGPNEIQHFFCDLQPVLNLSCTSAHISEALAGTLASIILLCSCLVTIISYFKILTTIIQIPTNTGRQKAFSTCASHLIVVVIFYGAMIFMYVKPSTSHKFSFNKIIAVLYTVVTPLFNPFIYTLRNKDVKQAFFKAVWSMGLLGVRNSMTPNKAPTLHR
ncbi:olfactory receptor 6F1-like [Pleurodeles waltl]|uniref:olfactory receptor 6F1-like n=1 Tax=Pleurodeles waltl TaxID=8319 RepID=UPI00370965EA